MRRTGKQLINPRRFSVARSLRALALASCSLFGLDQALACGFHMLPPEETLTQQLAGSDRIVLVRESEVQPFAFATKTVLTGPTAEVDIAYLVDSVTRRRLANNPDDTVLFAQSTDGGWRRLAYVSTETKPIYQSIVERSPSWATDPDDTGRFRFFAELHDHEDRAIRQLALSEFDRSAYRQLRELEVRLPSTDLLSALTDINEYPWVPIRILMLGVKGDSIARSAIVEHIERAEKTGRAANLAAWATALIEIDGAQAIDWLNTAFIGAEHRDVATIEAVLQALALHGAQGDPAHSQEIDRVLEATIAADPRLAPVAARAFASQGDFERVAIFERVMRERVLRSPAEIMPVVAYLAMAKENLSQQPTDNRAL